MNLLKTEKILLLILFFLMFLFPKTYMYEKAILFFVIVLVCILLSGGKFAISYGRKVLGFYILYNTFSILIGIVQGYGGVAVRSGTVTVLWPLFYLILMDMDLNDKFFETFYHLLVWLTFMLVLMDILFIIATMSGVLCIVEFFNELNLFTPIFGISSGMPVLRNDHLYFYSFLSPFFLEVLIVQGKKETQKVSISPIFLKCVAVLAISMSVISGMGGVWLALAVGFLITICKTDVLKKRNKIIVLLSFSLMIFVYCIYSFNSGGMVYYIVQEVVEKLGKKSGGEFASDSIRLSQTKAMLDMWMRSPIMGWGSGYPVSYIRGTLTSYNGGEASYMVILYQRGLIGLVSFLSVVIYAVKILKMRNDIHWLTQPFITGMICFLISNAFNPYFSNFSVMWILFFPFLFEKDIYQKNT